MRYCDTVVCKCNYTLIKHIYSCLLTINCNGHRHLTMKFFSDKAAGDKIIRMYEIQWKLTYKNINLELA